MIGDIEKGAVRRQGAAPRLGAHFDFFDYLVLYQVNDRNSCAYPICNKCETVVGADSDATRLFADADFGNLDGDILPVCIFDPDYRQTVRLAINDDDTRLVGG